MSCNESEKGGWTFPAKGWAQVRQRFLDAETEVQAKRHAVALKFYELSRDATGTYMDQKARLMKEAYNAVFGRHMDYFGRSESSAPAWAEEYYLPISYGKKGRPLKPKKPQKRKKEDRISFSVDDGCLVLDFKRRRIDWEVEENNHSVDRAWAHPLGQLLTAVLASTQFKGSNGGYTIYRGEYQESYEPDYRNVKGNKYRQQCGLPPGLPRTKASR